jgi:hypothetical protein
MESATFHKWLAEHGCRFDTDQEKRGTGHANGTVHGEGRKAEVPLGGPHGAARRRHSGLGAAVLVPAVRGAWEAVSKHHRAGRVYEGQRRQPAGR